jgi:SAM-dependent methyltransferase
MNCFGPGIDAARYARARPRIHAAAIDAFRSVASLSTRVSRALDAGCGTAESSVALADLADRVIGLDASPEMLQHAPAHPRIHYVQAAAEATPFASRTFDVITAALSFHWFDPNLFLAEAGRLLRPRGWLVIYTAGFTGQLRHHAGFAPWFLEMFPAPLAATRASGTLTAGLAEAHGLALDREERFVTEVPMTADQFIDFQLSTPNIIVAAARRDATLDEAARWFRESVTPFFAGRSHHVCQFAGTVWALTR